VLPNPDDPKQTNFIYSDRPYNLPFERMGVDVAGENIFMATMWGDMWQFDGLTGKMQQILSPGPEVAGCFGWEDAAKGLTAYRTPGGEDIIFTENSGFNGKVNFYRLRP
jgi:hypothetical protein